MSNLEAKMIDEVFIWYNDLKIYAMVVPLL